MLFTLHARLRVRRHPAFPTPFSWKGGEFSHNSDAFAPRERGRVCCPRRMPIDVVIASAAKQSSFLLSLTMDCFASLAMTVETVCRDATHHASSPRRCLVPGDWVDGIGVEQGIAYLGERLASWN